MNDLAAFGARVQKRRKELNLRQEDLAVKMGYKTKSSINKIEKGLADIPQGKIVQLAEALSTTPGYLMGWGEPSAFPNNSPEEIEKALDLYDQYKKAIPPIQNAVENLLKPDQPDS